MKITTPNRLRRASSAIAVASASFAIVLSALAFSDSNAGPDASEPEPMDEALCLRKVALDLTHRGPTEDELARLRAGDATIGDFADEYMQSSEFEQVVYNWYRGQFPPTELNPEGTDTEEAARIAQHIVLADKDYRELLTSTYTVDEDGNEVAVTDRPGAGVLSTQQYMSAVTGSFRRNWAGHFLAEWGDIRLEAVALPPDLEDTDLSPDNLLVNPACKGCHADEVWGVDYLASFARCYDDDGNYQGGDCSGTWLTQQGTGLQDLGRITADSKRFKAHTVNFFFEKFFGRHIAAEEAEFYLLAQLELTDSGYSARSLIRHIITSDVYCSN